MRTGPWPGCSTSSTISCASTCGSRKHLGEVHHPAAGHARGVQPLDPLARPSPWPMAALIRRRRRSRLRTRAVVVGERGILEQVRQLQRFEKAPDVHRACSARSRRRRPRHGTGRRDRPPGDRCRCAQAARRSRSTGGEVGQHADQPAGEAGLDLLAAPRCVPRRARLARRRCRTRRTARRPDRLIGGPARIGSPGAPVTLMKPLIAWAMKSNAGRSTYGPLLP